MADITKLCVSVDDTLVRVQLWTSMCMHSLTGAIAHSKLATGGLTSKGVAWRVLYVHFVTVVGVCQGVCRRCEAASVVHWHVN